MIKILIATLYLTLIPITALGHSWYPWECCSGIDCKPVPCDSLIETKEGIAYENYVFKDKQIRPSQDKFCHVCINNTNKPLCVFIQSNS